MSGRVRAGGVVVIESRPVCGRSRSGREVLIDGSSVRWGAVLSLPGTAVTVGGRVAPCQGRGGEQRGGGNRGGGEGGAVERGRGRGHEGAGLEKPQQLLVVAAQALLLSALLLHRVVQVGVLLCQLPVWGRINDCMKQEIQCNLRTNRELVVLLLALAAE